MSDKPQSNEPLIIKSDRPHEVTMPEGTNVAVGKKGEEGTPAVRKVLADPDLHAVEHIVMDAGVSQKAEQLHSVHAQDPNYKGYQSASEMPDRFVSNEKSATVPPPVRKQIDIAQLDSILKPQEKALGVDAIESQAVGEEMAAMASEPVYEVEPVMDFPARVINIKIENDQLRARLDKLE
ncbi:MAG: hypothetical protein NTX67_01580 [Burkholderiales bacterium]|nr:hypothetical protein [Burkholderiales bacterium]